MNSKKQKIWKPKRIASDKQSEWSYASQSCSKRVQWSYGLLQIEIFNWIAWAFTIVSIEFCIWESGFDMRYHVTYAIATFTAIALATSVQCDHFDSDKVVETKYGLVRGFLATSLIKRIDFYSFKGIPYAKSPTGNLRFKVNNHQDLQFRFWI